MIFLERMKNILVTGGAGFIGSNFIPYFLEKYEDYHIVNLDAMTYAGDSNNLKDLEGHPRYTFVKGDVCERKLLEGLFDKFDFYGVIHFAAESHVDRSIYEPAHVIETNVTGTFTLLQLARKKQIARFLHVSTDEVYGDILPGAFANEESQLQPSSPYSASKAGSDLLVRSYVRTYGFPAVITRSSTPKLSTRLALPTRCSTTCGSR